MSVWGGLNNTQIIIETSNAMNGVQALSESQDRLFFCVQQLSTENCYLSLGSVGSSTNYGLFLPGCSSNGHDFQIIEISKYSGSLWVHGLSTEGAVSVIAVEE